MRWLVTAILLCLCMPAVGRADQSLVPHGSKTLHIDNGIAVAVESATLWVPESRRHPTARRVGIPWYRLQSTAVHPAAPIFLLAGGPGASGLDQLLHAENFREVMFYRSIADVVVFDQRGAGHALPAMDCPQTAHYPAHLPLDWKRLRASLRGLLRACRDHWLQQGVDLSAYNTVESAADVDALRKAMGYRKITLIGGSYGSHLALQVMRLYPHAVDRAVLYGIEGPDQTWDDPDAVLAVLQRIAHWTERHAQALQLDIPPGGLLPAFARAVARLQQYPQQVTVMHDGKPVQVMVDADLLRLMLRHRAGSHDHPRAWPRMLLAMDRGDYTQAARAALDFRQLHVAAPMHWSMDCASGIDAARRARYARAPARALLGDINREYGMLCDAWPARDAGAAYRADVVSSLPTLLIHGSWDVSTPMQNAREVARGLRESQLISVVGGNHGALYNLYDHWPPMHALMRTFLSGRAIKPPTRVVMPWVEPAARASR